MMTSDTTTPVDEPAGPSQFLFVVENGLGHAVHATNIESVLTRTPGIRGRVIRVAPGTRKAERRVPLTDNWSLQASLLTRRAVLEHMSNEPVDALFIHTQVASLLATAIMHRIPTVVSLDATPVGFDTMASAYRHGRQQQVVEWGKQRVTRRALRSSAAVVAWSRWAADSVVHDYGVPGEHVHVVPPGVDIARFRPRATPRRDGPVRVLFVGGDFDRKGGHDLLAAVGRLTPGTVELHLVTGTEVALRGVPVTVHNGIAPNSPELIGLLRDADIFALPSRGDCTPLAIAEALACGLPIVASSVGAIPELVVDGMNGLVVPPGDPLGLATALARLVDDESLRIEMGRRSRAMAESDHDVVRNCRRLFTLMSQVADAAVGPHVPQRRRGELVDVAAP